MWTLSFSLALYIMRRLIFTNNTKLNDNNYTNGSGVGVVNSSNRAALKRRASKSACCTYINQADVIKINTPVRYIKVFFPNKKISDYVQLSQLAVYSNGINIAPAGTASALNTFAFANPPNKEKPIDGTLAPRAFPNVYISLGSAAQAWWVLDLKELVSVDQIVYYNRTDADTNVSAIGMSINTYVSSPPPGNEIGSPVHTFTCTADLIQTFNL
jgi:hypothetical protein